MIMAPDTNKNPLTLIITPEGNGFGTNQSTPKEVAERLKEDGWLIQMVAPNVVRMVVKIPDSENITDVGWS